MVQKYENGIHTRTGTESPGRRTKLNSNRSQGGTQTSGVLGCRHCSRAGSRCCEIDPVEKSRQLEKLDAKTQNRCQWPWHAERSTGTEHLTRRHETPNLDYSSGRRKLIQHVLRGKIQHRTTAVGLRTEKQTGEESKIGTDNNADERKIGNESPAHAGECPEDGRLIAHSAKETYLRPRSDRSAPQAIEMTKPTDDTTTLSREKQIPPEKDSTWGTRSGAGLNTEGQIWTANLKQRETKSLRSSDIKKTHSTTKIQKMIFHWG
jgi:hypothetical protein